MLIDYLTRPRIRPRRQLPYVHSPDAWLNGVIHGMLLGVMLTIGIAAIVGGSYVAR